MSGPIQTAAPPPQTSPNAPKRRPVKPSKDNLGTYGVAYFTYPTGITNGGIVFSPVPMFKDTADYFASVAGRTGLKKGFIKSDRNLSVNELKRSELGGSNLFNSVNLGVLMAHGRYGTSVDFSPYCAASFQTYVGIGGTNTQGELPLSQFHFGGELRWMVLLACDLLRDQNYFSMFGKQVLPIGDELHLLLGASTEMSATQTIMGNWMHHIGGGNAKIREGWFNAVREDYSKLEPPEKAKLPNPTVLRVAGWDGCWEDKLKSYIIPDPSIDLIQEQAIQVYP